MTPMVTVATARLRYGLLDLSALYGKQAADAWMVGEPDAQVMREHKVRAKAIDDLLDEIGWGLDELTLPYQLDLARFGWAAIAGLEQVIEYENNAQYRSAVLGEDEHEAEVEACGAAGGRRLDAETALGLIQAACQTAELIIAEPKP